jgi:hypothetical protein
VNDLAVSKLVAGRDKDVDWVETAIKSKLARADLIASRLHLVDVDPRIIALAKARIDRMATKGDLGGSRD